MNKNKLIESIKTIDQEILKLLENKFNVLKNAEKLDSDLIISLKHEEEHIQSHVIGSSLVKQWFLDFFNFFLEEMKIETAFLGPEGTFSHQAALDIFGPKVEYKPQKSIADIFYAVDNENASFGVVPIENSYEGAVNLTLDLLKDSDLNIYGEKTININHHLIGCGTLQDVKEIYSHPQILGQCKNWIKDNCPQAELIETSSSIWAIKKIEQQIHRASIGTDLGARQYNYPIIQSSIQDSSSNKTRFFILSKKTRPPKDKNKTSIFFLCQNEPGALVNVLQIFHKHQINLTKIESRPSKLKNWEYCFFVDFNGHTEENIVKKAIEEIRKKTYYLKILGSYPMG